MDGRQYKNKNESEAYGTHYWKGVELDETENLDGDDSKVTMDRVIPFIDNSVENGNTFFSVVWLHTPHLPVVVKREIQSILASGTN